MDHLDYQEQISQFIDNEITEPESPALFVHLGGCKECREFFQESMRLRSTLLSSSNAHLPQSLKNAVWSGARAIHYPLLKRPTKQWGFSNPIASVALFLLIVLFTGVLFSARIEVQGPTETAPTTTTSPFPQYDLYH